MLQAYATLRPASAGDLLDDELDDDEVAALYRACDVLVHPYRGEGFAMPVLEAMACGLPVITTGGRAHRRVLSPGGRLAHPAPSAVRSPATGSTRLRPSGVLGCSSPTPRI